MRLKLLARLVKFVVVRYVAEARPPDFEVVRVVGREPYLGVGGLFHVTISLIYIYIKCYVMMMQCSMTICDASCSIVLGNGIVERYQVFPPDGEIRTRRFYMGDIVWRSSDLAHQLIIEQPSWTVFITGPRVKQWGFWCPKGWRHWKDYVALSQASDGSGRGESGIGVGCGEN